MEIAFDRCHRLFLVYVPAELGDVLRRHANVANCLIQQCDVAVICPVLKTNWQPAKSSRRPKKVYRTSRLLELLPKAECDRHLDDLPML